MDVVLCVVVVVRRVVVRVVLVADVVDFGIGVFVVVFVVDVVRRVVVVVYGMPFRALTIVVTE